MSFWRVPQKTDVSPSAKLIEELRGGMDQAHIHCPSLYNVPVIVGKEEKLLNLQYYLAQNIFPEVTVITQVSAFYQNLQQGTFKVNSK